MMFELRKLNGDDVFLMVDVLYKIGYKDIKAELKNIDVAGMMKNFSSDSAEAKTAIGMNAILIVVDILMRNLPKCKSEICTLMGSISGITAKQVQELDIVTFTELLIAIIKKEEFLDFFKVVARLFNSVT